MRSFARHMPAHTAAASLGLSNELLLAAGASSLSGIMSKFETVNVNVGDVLFEGEVKNNYVFFPQNSVISHVYVLKSGASVEAAMIGREGASGLCGLLPGEKPQHTAKVVFGGQASRITVEDLAAATLYNPPLQTALYQYLTSHLADVEQRVACRSFHLGQERLCTWLLTLNEKAKSREISITHEEISSLLGINRVSVSTGAIRLKDQRIIDYARGRLSILDRSRLESLACECYRSRTRRHSSPSTMN